MKKHFFAYFVVTALSLTITGSSLAGGWQTATKVTQYLIEGSSEGDSIYVGFETNFNPDSCSAPGLGRVYGNTAKGKFIFASVLSAKATSQTVIPFLNGCDNLGRPILSGILTQ